MVQAILLSGKRGAGKSISAVRLMDDYLSRGCTVATNMAVYPDKLCGAQSKKFIYRLPDVPSLEDFEGLPKGNPNPVMESKNGLIVLDEVGTFLNSREWKDKSRGGTISWFLHSRKLGWDLCLIAQHPRLVDAQIRDGLCEISATCRRMDNLRIPIIGLLLKLLKLPFKLPKLHIIVFKYGFSFNAPNSDIWIFSGAKYYDCYDSLQQISPLNDSISGVCCALSGWHLKGRYMSWFDRTKGALAASFIGGLVISSLAWGCALLYIESRQASSVTAQLNEDKPIAGIRVIGLSGAGHKRTAVLSNGEIGIVTGESFRAGERLYQVNGQYYQGKF
jgi:hypothetical protein